MAEHANVYPLRREPEREPQREREPQPEPRPQERQTRERQVQEPLWREVLGRRLRVLRQEQQETLSETAARAGISPQYLSEIERGRKEPSSEMIAALAGALGTTLIDVTEHVAGDLRRQMSLAPRASRTRPGRTRPGDILALAA
jgi:DNA-binding XRE family transcriptional regulator